MRETRAAIRHGLVALAAVVGFGVAGAGGAAANMLTNGSLTGPVANGGVPTGWSVLLNSPDTNDVSNNVGGTTPFVTAPVGPSPDGGTWVGLGSSPGFNESFGQNLAGLSVGANYNLSWYEGNFGANVGCPFYCSANAFEALIDNVVVGSGATLASDDDWYSSTISFVATSSTATLSFRLRDDAAAYLSIDGISLEASVTTPEPASMALFGAGLFGLMAARRRRA